MSNLQAKFASALVFGIIAGAAATILPQSAARAADNCLTEPGKDAQGKHWYFHIERGTGRHCWYQRGQDGKAARADTADAPAEKQAPGQTEAAASRSIANAHAEIAPRAPVPDDASAPAATAVPAAAAAPSVWPGPQAATATADSETTNAPAATAAPDQSSVASRWPQTSSSAPAAPAAQPDASLMAADSTPDSSAAADPAPQAAPPPALAAAPVERNTGSLQKLLLVAFGALALAGLTGSAVYRLGRRRRRNDWLRERTNWQSIDNPLDPPWVGPEPAYVNRSVPDLDEARAMASRLDVSQALETDESGDRVEKIEEFLARLTKQLQSELEGTERDARASS